MQLYFSRLLLLLFVLYKTPMTDAQVKNGPQNGHKKGYALLAGAASIVTVAALILMKGYAYWVSGSVSVLASLTDSLMDAAVSLISFCAIGYSLKPADDNHRFGHGKIEGVAALLQAAFIVGAGAFLVFESMRHLTRPEMVEDNLLVLGVMVCSVLLSIGLVLFQKFSLRYAPSLAVEADHAHYSGDIAINAGVVIVLMSIKYGAPRWIDPAFAVIVALYLGYTAKIIAMKGMDMLLDREVSEEMRAQIFEIIDRHPEAVGAHDLRTRKAGMDLHIAFDLEIDPDKSLRDAHDVALQIEQEILELFPNAEIMIHKDPAGVPHTDSRHPNLGVHD